MLFRDKDVEKVESMGGLIQNPIRLWKHLPSEYDIPNPILRINLSEYKITF
jgi:hypothetical protein